MSLIGNILEDELRRTRQMIELYKNINDEVKIKELVAQEASLIEMLAVAD